MRRTDRLFELIQIIRDGRLYTAADLAERLEVSVRTIYRDVETLVASGVPIEGERGVGYLLRAPIFLPPVTLTQVELEALHLGAALVQSSADPELQEAAARLVAKVDQVMPDTRRPPSDGWGVDVYGAPQMQAGFAFMPLIRTAIRGRRKLDMAYLSERGLPTRRIIRPLHMEYWGHAWTCTAWCETRNDFRVFRLDRIQGLIDRDEVFEDTPGQRFVDFMAQHEQQQQQQQQ